jgi:CHAD domain-containing protein
MYKNTMPGTARQKAKSHADARRRLLADMRSDLQKATQAVMLEPTAVAVHDVRVAARRLRAMLRSLRSEANPGAYAQLRFDLTNLGREFADVRTADMHVATVDGLLNDSTRTHAKDRTHLKALLERMATSARRSLAQRMLDPAWQHRLARIGETLESDDLLLKPMHPVKEEYGAMLVASIDESLDELSKRKTSIQALHKQRIRIKSTRYVCETLSDLLGSDTRRLQGRLNKAQDLLGEIHDLHALDHWLSTTSIPTPLAEPLAKLSSKRQTQLLKKFPGNQQELRKCLQRTLKATQRSAA